MGRVLDAVLEELLQDEHDMTMHQILFRTSEQLIAGTEFSADEKDRITSIFLSSVSARDKINRFHRGVQAPSDGRVMYPLYYIPPYSQHKRMTITGAMPKTHIFSTNYYELETLRLLAMWRPEDPSVKEMLQNTVERLSTTCFGQYCGTGECFEASIVALRFLSCVVPDKQQWIDRLFAGIRREIDNKANGAKRSSGVYFYYFLTLSELELEIVDGEIRRYQQQLERCINESGVCKTVFDRIFKPIRVNIARNCLSRLPELSHLKCQGGSVGVDGMCPITEDYPHSLEMLH